MHLKILLPTHVLLDATAVHKVVIEALNGSHGLLPRHVDFVTALAPGILSYHDDAGEHHVALDEGTLIKVGAELRVSSRSAVPGDDLFTLRQTVASHWRHLDEQEQQARTVLARLEAATLERFLQLEAHQHD